MYAELLPEEIHRQDAIAGPDNHRLAIVEVLNENKPYIVLKDYLDFAQDQELKTDAMAEYLAFAEHVHTSGNLQEIVDYTDELAAAVDAVSTWNHVTPVGSEDADLPGENSIDTSPQATDESIMGQTTEVQSIEADQQPETVIPTQLGVEFGYLPSKKGIRAIRFKRSPLEVTDLGIANAQLAIEEDQVKGRSKRLTKAEKTETRLRKIMGDYNLEIEDKNSGIGHSELGIRPIAELRLGKDSAITGWLGPTAIMGSSLFCAYQFLNRYW